ncbi:hypothetical protein [Streptomyces virginiae]|uniref:hypothetical protein n=1 Tax=Streptomyces virginiae TaxID=1961 RepID=UPI00324F6FA7
MTRDMVLDGQLVVRDGDAERVSVEALQRWARGVARIAARRWPAHFVAFDLSQYDGQAHLTRP